MSDKYLTFGMDGNQRLKSATAQSVGESSAGEIVALDDSGKIDPSMMPTGIGAPTRAILTSETLNAGDLINIFDDEGVMKVRKADASDATKFAHGFVEEGFASGTTATIYFSGEVDQTIAEGSTTLFLTKTPGRAGTYDPTAAIRQSVGCRTAAGAFVFVPGTVTLLS